MCTSQSLFSLAVAIQCTSRELLDLSDVQWRRYFQRNLFVERKIVYLLISLPCIESFPRLPTRKSFGLLKASGSQIYCSSSPHRKKPLESSESFDRTIAEVKQSRMFSVMADEATGVSNKENLLVLRYVDSSNNIREEFSGVRHC